MISESVGEQNFSNNFGSKGKEIDVDMCQVVTPCFRGLRLCDSLCGMV